jgi:hypothetical protein
MRINRIAIPAFIFFFSFYIVEGQPVVSPSSSQKICYAGNKVNRIYIPPPHELSRVKGLQGASIKVSYSGFSVDAKAAMEYAVSILSSVLPSDVKISVQATWKQMTETGILGSSGVSGYYFGSYFNAFNPYVYYPGILIYRLLLTAK